MDNQHLALVATVVAGGLIALQAPINAALGRAVASPIAAASISFAVGTATLVAITLFAGGYGGVGGASGLGWFYFAGGLLGAVYVTTALMTVRTLGAGAVTAATVTGQLVTALAVDRIGAFGLAERPLSWSRLLGVALLAAGTFLVVRGR